MDFSDFLIEYDLTEPQRQLAAKLKAQANLRQLLNSLADHALFFSREVADSRRAGRQFGPKEQQERRSEVLAWFSQLDAAQRVSVLSCEDSTWVRTVLKMCRLQGSSCKTEGRFRLGPPKVPPAPAGGGPKAGRAERRGGTVAPVNRDPSVQCRQPHRLPDGMTLTPPGSKAHRRACTTLLTELRVTFKASSNPSLVSECGAVVASPRLVEEPAAFVALLDEISMGRFLLAGDCSEKAVKGVPALPWQDAPWISQWGSHFPLAAFLASRLEVLLLQGFGNRLGPTPLPSPPCLEVWETIPEEERHQKLQRVGHWLLRRLLAENITSTNSEGSWQPPTALATALEEAARHVTSNGDGSSSSAERLAEIPPLSLVGAVTGLPLLQAAASSDTPVKEVPSRFPQVWLHQQLAQDVAVVCSEFSAQALLTRATLEEEEEGARSKRGAKKQRQKMRKRQADEEAAKKREEEEARVQRRERANSAASSVLNEVLEGMWQSVLQQRVQSKAPTSSAATTKGRRRAQREAELAKSLVFEAGSQPEDAGSDTGDRKAASEASLKSLVVEETLRARGPRGPGSAGLDDCGSEISSSLGSFGRASRSNSVDALGFGAQQLRSRSQFSLLERGFWDSDLLHRHKRPGWQSRRWHDDSRLEFLLRSRNRESFATDLEWDRLSQGSVPASLDERTLYPVGLESRFGYLFDSPPRSHVTTALASQATTDDDAERLRAQWEDADFVEWRSLAEALEKSEREREMWKTKAEELEALAAKSGPGSTTPPTSVSVASARPAGTTTPPTSVSVASAARPSGGSPVTDEVPLPGPAASSSAPPGSAAGPSSPLPPVTPSGMKRSTTGGSTSSVISADPSPVVDAWRYMVLLVLARRQVDLQREAFERQRLGLTLLAADTQVASEIIEETLALSSSPPVAVGRSCSTPGLQSSSNPFTSEESSSFEDPSAAAVQSSSATAAFPNVTPWLAAAKKRALHVTFEARCKRSFCDSATQTAPAITLSKMYGGIVPRYIQRELARLRQENQILRYRLASLAMSQSFHRPKPVRHQATQTAPAITFSTARQQGSVPTVPVGSFPRLPQGLARLPQVSPPLSVFPAGWVPTVGPSDHGVRDALDESMHAFVSMVESQPQSQDVYRHAIQSFCRRAAQVLWPRCSAEYSGGRVLPLGCLEIDLRGHRHELRIMEEEPDEANKLSPIDEESTN